jgi:hypothetical protein
MPPAEGEGGSAGANRRFATGDRFPPSPRRHSAAVCFLVVKV